MAGKKPKERGQEDPFAKGHKLFERRPLQLKAVRLSRQIKMREHQFRHRPDNAADDQGRHGFQQHRQHNHHRDADHLTGQIQRGQPPHQQMPLRGINPRGIEPRNEQGQRRNRQISGKLRRSVKDRDGIGQSASDPPQDHAPHHLNGPGGVQKGRVIATFGLRNRGRNPHVRKQRQPHGDHAQQRHQAESFGKEQPRQDQV